MRTVRPSARAWGCRSTAVGLAAMLGLGLPLEAAATETSTDTPVPGDAVVATVDGESISADAVRHAFLRLGPGAARNLSSVDEKATVVEDLARVHVLAGAASAAGYAEKPEVRDAVRRLLAEAYWRDRAAELDLPAVTDHEVRAWYEEHLDRYTESERRRGAVLTLRPKNGEPTGAIARTEELLVQARASDARGFASLVRRWSEDPATRREGGDTGFVLEGSSLYRLAPEIVDALFALDEIGDVVAVESRRGAHLVRLAEVQGGHPLALETVEGEIRRLLTQRRRDDALGQLYAELRGRSDIEIDREVLRRIGPGDLGGNTRPPSFPIGDRP